MKGCSPHSHTSLACLGCIASFLVAATVCVCIGGNLPPPMLISLASPTCRPTDMLLKALLGSLILMIAGQKSGDLRDEW